MWHAKAVRVKAQEASDKTVLSDEKELPELQPMERIVRELPGPDKTELPDKNRLRGKPYEEVDVVGQRKSLESTLFTSPEWMPRTCVA